MHALSRKTLIITLLSAALIAAAPAGAAPAALTVQVSNGAHHPLGVTCSVSLPAGSNGGEALDAAASAGCISGWSYDSYSFGRLVTCIDDLCGAPAPAFYVVSWSFLVNGECSSVGIDDYTAVSGDVLKFKFGYSWLTFAAGQAC